MFSACEGGSPANAELPAHTRQKIKGMVYNFTPAVIPTKEESH